MSRVFCPLIIEGFIVPIACLISNRWLNGILKIFLNANDSYYTMDANDSQIQMILIILRMILIYRMKIFLAWFMLRTPVSSKFDFRFRFVFSFTRSSKNSRNKFKFK